MAAYIGRSLCMRVCVCVGGTVRKQMLELFQCKF